MGAEVVREGPSSRVAASGGLIEVRLPEIPSSGYRWDLQNAGDPLVRVVSTRFEEDAGEKGMAGGAGTRTFVIELLDPSIQSIGFVLKQPWQAEAIEQRLITIAPSATE
ncbi:protease inhibitor I42 family protein [Nonomuraea zeae]|uniref:Proteinase inhibitor I42 chagasin domain-containing protein n=1 Tax=Nonomuraea zeae TaxID=1642303 RepID=A0A5S4GA53_9ACTN|nr:protease inhibitor I42 family protein [Nonomuraea zeae]TMR29394.1 hypothetical protein ETD85_32610 [Nonomuraea zeae]